MKPRIRIKANSQFVEATPDESATATGLPPGSVAVADHSVSPGVVRSSLPSGENDPSVKLAWAPGESFPDLPAFLKRERDNVAPYARAG